MPKVSINIITHNRKQLLKKAIASVFEQTYTDFELIIVDDSSSDGTEEEISLLTDPRIKYKKIEKQNNVSAVRNKALSLSTGEYIALLDDDDIWIDKDKLRQQVEFLDKNHGHVLVGTGAIVVDENDKEKYRFLNPQDDKKIKSNMLSRCLFVNSSTMFKNETAKKIHGYQTKPYGQFIEDYNFWLDLGKHRKLANLPIFSIKYKEHNNQQSSKYRKNQTTESVKLIKDYKHDYPNYIKAKIRTNLRAAIYGYLNMTWLYSITAFIKEIRNKKK